MAKPNYSFEKRQRELAKKKKKEQKLARKASDKEGQSGDEAETQATETQATETGVPASPPTDGTAA